MRRAQRIDGALLFGTIDAYYLCDADTVEVRLRAHWQACPEAEPDCEIPEALVSDGDRFSCPASGATQDLGVELTTPGRYRVEAIQVLTTGPSRFECFVDPQTGDTRVELPSSRLFEGSPVVLDEHGPCPEG